MATELSDQMRNATTGTFLIIKVALRIVRESSQCMNAKIAITSLLIQIARTCAVALKQNVTR